MAQRVKSKAPVFAFAAAPPSTLRTTETGFRLIGEFENCKLSAYKCPAGIWTVGWGLTTAAGIIKVGPTTKISKAQADQYFMMAVDKFEDQVEHLLGTAAASLTPHQFDALVSLTYNIGVGAFAKSTLLKRIKTGRFDLVPAEFLKWDKVNGQPSAGLTRRRKAEAALWEDDVHEAAYHATQIHVAAPNNDTIHDDVDMPQQVDEPPGPKSMATSAIGNGTIATGGLGTLAAGKELVSSAQDAMAQGHSLLDQLGTIAPWALVVIAIIGCAAFVWWERNRKLQEQGV